jgi:hypothetical protein
MCRLLVSGFLTEITQQIHSLRASGVISCHFARAAGSEMRTFRRSAGTLCTAPGEIALGVMGFILHVYVLRLRSARTASSPSGYAATQAVAPNHGKFVTGSNGNGQTSSCRALRGDNGSRHSRCGFRVLQKPILGTAGSEHWHCLSVRRFLREIPQASMNKPSLAPNS